MLDPRDKRIIHTYTSDVDRVAAQLREAIESTKDPEWKGFLRRSAEDLEHVTADIKDTVSRL